MTDATLTPQDRPAAAANAGPAFAGPAAGDPGIAGAAPADPGIAGLGLEWTRLGGPPPVYRASVTREQWSGAAAAVRAQGGRLVALWGIDRRNSDGRFAVACAYALPGGLFWLDLAMEGGARDVSGVAPGAAPGYPELATKFPFAARMQRAVADLCGLAAEGAADIRSWVRQQAWPADYYPLRREPSGRERFAAGDEQYPFVAVEGDGVHEIAVGPVHAGIIEPGHFRFSVVGEKVLRLEERLGYTHKGIEKRFEGMELTQGALLAARVSGDTTVAYGWAYCAAAEALRQAQVPARAQWLRAFALERERVANHLADLGALGNDAGLAFGLAQFSRLREDWLRRNAELAGHRLLMDWIVPGGMRSDCTPAQLALAVADCDALQEQVRILAAIYDAHPGLQDRFAGTGRVDAALARTLGLTGMAARASGAGSDLRADFAPGPYGPLRVKSASARGGDVAARVIVRFAEVNESLRLLRAIAQQLPAGAACAPLPTETAQAFGAGWIEAWRGEVLVTIETDGRGRIARAHCHDPSWQNWPVLEHAVIGNIVPDFPLINKSFNLSYSGQDL